jgi:hypothetical protein
LLVLIAQLELLLPQFGLAMAVAADAAVVLAAGEETVEPMLGVAVGVIDVAGGVVPDVVLVVVVSAVVVPPVVVTEVLVEEEGLGDDEVELADVVVLDPEAGPPAMANATLPEPEDIPPSVLDNC